ncbi:unnamed protein product [Brugia timori]|uniref:Ephrin RBD domain-containing protein n=1 Tax=Brugia timori TaxID=42155 RepID=A0A0R3R6W3_9BILA|nr:unnamed protein product [Brugia timori]
MVSLQPITIIITLIISAVIYGCAPPGFIPNQDPSFWKMKNFVTVNRNLFLNNKFLIILKINHLILAYIAGQCSDLILYPVKSVDQDDQYRFDYSDVSFGNTHSQGATVTITCTERGRPATVEGYDQVLKLTINFRITSSYFFLS